MAYEHIEHTINQGIATITFNPPTKMGAITEQMLDETADAVERARTDPEIRVLVLTGKGRAFCSGADVANLLDQLDKRPMAEYVAWLERGTHRITRGLRQLGKPAIASVNGPAVGGGCDIALACDLRVASEFARFGEVYVRLGTVPINGGMWFMPRIVGVARACELLYTGDIIDAQEAYRIGLVNRLVPPEDLERETRELARRIALGPPIAIKLIREGIFYGLNQDLDGALQYAQLAMGIADHTDDYREGVTAFLEKRRPVFRGR